MIRVIRDVQLINIRRELLFRLDGEEAQSIKFTSPEFRVLEYLINHAGETITKQQLIMAGWEGQPTGDNSLTVVISNLRKKIKHSTDWDIINIPKVGYWLDCSNIEQTKENKIAKATLPTKIEIRPGMLYLLICFLITSSIFPIVYITNNWLSITCNSTTEITVCSLDKNLLSDVTEEIQLTRDVESNFISKHNLVNFK